MLVKFAHQWLLEFNRVGIEEEPLMISFDEADARKRHHDLKTLVIPGPIVHHITQTKILVSNDASGCEKCVQRRQVAVHIAEYGYDHSAFAPNLSRGRTRCKTTDPLLLRIPRPRPLIAKYRFL